MPAGPVVKTAPGQISVKVFNASGIANRATQVAAALEALGFHVSGVAIAPSVQATTVVHYSPGYDESGRTLTTSVISASSVPDSSLGGTLYLYVGTDYTGVQKVTVATTATPALIVRTAANSSCVV